MPENLFQASAAQTVEELARACEPSLKGLLKEAATGQGASPLDEEAARGQADDLFARTLQEAGVERAPEAIEGFLRQAVLLLDHASHSHMQGYGHAFQPLLRPLEEHSLQILEKRLRPRIPASQSEQIEYFNPYLGDLPDRQRSLLEKHQRYLRDNLVFGRAIQRLGTLLFCLDYAQQGGWGVAGVWRDVEKAFSGAEMACVYQLLNSVNEFRNTRVAHVEVPLEHSNEAWKAMKEWVRCLVLLCDVATS
ncbi:MAG: hypothetical protein C4341_09820 [Armatimonadota bacterium]